jgi:hypothetical protein
VDSLRSGKELFNVLANGMEPPTEVEVVDPPEKDIEIIELLEDDE